MSNGNSDDQIKKDLLAGDVITGHICDRLGADCQQVIADGKGASLPHHMKGLEYPL